ncbi:MAG TPA: protein TolQ [Deltaproteobacteria bacterium]|nr:protein TolQ [Deltaproteobacteria bacterium]
MNIFLATTAVVGARYNAWDLMLHAGPMVKVVMLILVLSSVVCWTIIVAKYRMYKEANKYTELFLNNFYEGSGWDDLFKKMNIYRSSPLAHVFHAGYNELEKSNNKKGSLDQSHFDNIIRALRRAIIAETTRLERMIYFLATTGATAPFIGLFGTVWGIMNSFQGIGATGVANLAVVAPGISEALIATAIGLAAAIPAVVAYNYFQSRLRVFISEMENFASDFTNIIKRSM